MSARTSYATPAMRSRSGSESPANSGIFSRTDDSTLIEGSFHVAANDERPCTRSLHPPPPPSSHRARLMVEDNRNVTQADAGFCARVFGLSHPSATASQGTAPGRGSHGSVECSALRQPGENFVSRQAPTEGDF